MYVYVIGPDQGPQKIGVSAKPETRLAQLKTSSPFSIAIRAMVEMASEAEARLVERTAHRQLAQHRMEREWFDVSAEVAAAMVESIATSVKDGTLEAKPYLITPGQIRAARALLGWKQTDLAAHAEVSEISVKNIERGATDARGSTLGKIQRALEAAGVEIIPADGASISGGPGVRLRRPC